MKYTWKYFVNHKYTKIKDSTPIVSPSESPKKIQKSRLQITSNYPYLPTTSHYTNPSSPANKKLMSVKVELRFSIKNTRKFWSSTNMNFTWLIRPRFCSRNKKMWFIIPPSLWKDSGINSLITAEDGSTSPVSASPKKQKQINLQLPWLNSRNKHTSKWMAIWTANSKYQSTPIC